MVRLIHVILASAAVVHTGGAATWTTINTGLPSSPVYVTTIAIASKLPSTIYARTVSPIGTATLFKSTDGAQSWSALSGLAGVNSLVIDPQNAATLYAITSRGVFKSTDGGGTWNGASTGLGNSYIIVLAIDPVFPSKLYAATPAGIFKSTDGAGSWNLLDTGIPSNSFISSLIVDPANPANVYAVAAIPRNNGPSLPALLKSTDEGATWNRIDDPVLSNSGIVSLVIDPKNPATLYATTFPAFGGAPSRELLKSTDGGNSWGPVQTNLPGGADISSVIVDPTDSSTLYVAVNFSFAQAGGILKSTDGGATWNAVKSDLPANTPIQYLAVDPVSPSNIYSIGNGTLLRSIDGGAHWTRAAAGLEITEVTALAVNPMDASVYTGAANNIYKSSDGGASWNKLYTFQLFASSPPPAFLSAPFPDGAPAYPQSILIDSVDPENLYVSTTRGNGCYFADNLLFKSTDGGVNWSNTVSPATSGCLLGAGFGVSGGLKAIDKTNPNTLYVAEADDGDEDWEVLRTDDGGVSWKSIGAFPANLQTGVWTLAIDPTTPATLYAGMDDVPLYNDNGATPGSGGIFKSTDGGASWNSAGLSGAAVTLVAIDPSQPNVLYAVTEGNYGTPRGFRGLFKSTDSGTSWSAMNNGLNSLLEAGSNIAALTIDPSDPSVIYIGTSGQGIFKTSDGGANWIPFNDGLVNLNVRVLALAPGATPAVYAGTSGGVFKTTDPRN